MCLLLRKSFSFFGRAIFASSLYGMIFEKREFFREDCFPLRQQS